MARSTWYHNLNALNRMDKHADIKQQIRDIYLYHKGRYGYRRVTLSLRKQGNKINHKKVQRLMSELSLKARIRIKKYRSWKGEVGKIAKNVLQRDFNAQKNNEKWVTDVTEFSVKDEKLYLSPVMDLFNGEIIAYNISERPTMKMIYGMLEHAFTALNSEDTPVLHSDQGWQYQMQGYQKKLKEHGIVQSMSRKGNYSFTSQPVVDALIAAHERGVTVSVVVNKGSINGNGAKARYLKQNNVPIKMNAKYSIMHNKFFLVDNKSLKTGSFNYSAAAHQRNAENILIIRCVDDVITQYQQEFTRLWDESIEIPEIPETSTS